MHCEASTHTLRGAALAGSRGVNLAADIGGGAGQASVILLHGGGQTRHSWGKAASDLAGAGYHVISLDLRGHGDSDWAPDADYTLEAFVGDLRAVIDTLDQPPVIIGASLGGATALVAVGEAEASLARALVLVDVVPRMSSGGVEQIRAFMQGNLGGFATVQEAADAVARYLPNRPRPSSSDGLLKNLREGPDGRLYWHWDPAFQVGDRRIDASLMTARMEAAARRVRVPTLLVRGKQSDVVSHEGASQLLALMPHAASVDVEGAGHMVAGDRNDIFNSAILAFLADLE
ncbi:alpha/beta hydrolase [Pseudomonas sp. S31]|uniref:alpha/beta fold hydrolase n=1 Tax=Pseudomonas sp. S31 TaxID=1564473 RepID=UPI001912ECE2|nr:alpha/beta hydrolase [Pseudomonas sp. S31]MBK4998749.1 alpha/beta hydrolase [Pseudomonas sp. S31]